VAGLEEHLERRLGERGIVAVQAQRAADRLEADGAQVVRPVGPLGGDLCAQREHSAWAAEAVRRRGRVRPQPGRERALGGDERRLDGPQRVVEIEREAVTSASVIVRLPRDACGPPRATSRRHETQRQPS
jgi:hypothetical protein